MIEEATERERSGRIIGKILPAAIRLWLRSQAEQVENISINLLGRDRDLLSGYVPGISLAAQQAIYQGIRIGHLQLSAEDIRINIGQVVRGKPLRLLKAFPVVGEITLTEADLNASLASALLVQGLTEFWRSLVQEPSMAASVKSRYGTAPLHPDAVVENASAKMSGECLGVCLGLQAEGHSIQDPVILAAGLTVTDSRYLQLLSARWIESLEEVSDLSSGEPIDALQDFQWNLGSDTKIDYLRLYAGQMDIKGQITVNP